MGCAAVAGTAYSGDSLHIARVLSSATAMPSDVRPCPSCQTPLPLDAQFCLRCGVATPTDPGVPPRTASTDTFEIGRVKRALADHYRVDRVLGEGGMATVYLAEDLKHHRKVAVKVMRPELGATLGAERFLREVQIAAQLSHPHILPVHDSGEAGGLLYYVMPHVEGQTLRERLQQENQLPVEEALRLAREIAEALAYAHGRGIIHRDIKPGNVLLQSGHALVADFGIARAVEQSGKALTETGLSVGTPQYMAPEQAGGDHHVDGRADVYAVGAVLYEMLAGEPPFTGPTSRVIVMRSMTEAPRPVTASRAGLAPAVDAVVLKALAKAPADRYPTADAFAAALDHAHDAVRSGAVPVATVPIEARRAAAGAGRRLTWRNAALAAAAALFLWAVAATALAFKRSAALPSGGGSRIAVLPFANQGAAEDGYFADGISDEVRGKLAQVDGLTVIASSSAGQYRQSTKTPQEIARELNVGYLLVGKVRWSGAPGTKRRVQVVPELVNGATGATAWQQTFDTDVTDVFQVQAQIATQVAAALGTRLGAQERQQLAKRPTTNAAAYDLYLKGRALTSVDPVTSRQAAAFFEQAVALDSMFLEAWSGLSSALARVYFNGSRDPVVAARAREAMRRALAIDPNGALTQVAVARYYTNIEPDPAKAATAIAQALRTAPNDATVLAMAAAVDMSTGQIATGIVKLEHARDVDPRSAATMGALQQAYVLQRRFADAIAAGAAAHALDPNDLNQVEWQAIAYLAQGDVPGARGVTRSAVGGNVTAPAVAAFFGGYQELSWVLEPEAQALLLRLTPVAFDNDRAWWGQTMATAYWERGDKAMARAYADSALAPSAAQVAASPGDAQVRSLYALMLAYVGRAAEARAEADTAASLTTTTASANNHSYAIMQRARILLAIGDTDRALDAIELLLKQPYMVTPAWLRVDPTFAALKGNPRFERLAAQ